VFTNKKKEGVDTFVCAVSLYVTETTKAPIKDQKPPLPIEKILRKKKKRRHVFVAYMLI